MLYAALLYLTHGLSRSREPRKHSRALLIQHRHQSQLRFLKEQKKKNRLKNKIRVKDIWLECMRLTENGLCNSTVADACTVLRAAEEGQNEKKEKRAAAEYTIVSCLVTAREQLSASAEEANGMSVRDPAGT